MRRPRYRGDGEEAVRPGRLEIILIDELPLRSSLADECAGAMERLERARLGWHQFERQDRPAFIRWRAREFGALLSTAREVEEHIRDAQNLIHEVEMEMRRDFRDPSSAYRRVMSRRNRQPGDLPDEPERSAAYGGTTGAGPARRLTEFEQEALFHEWVQRFLGTNPDKMDDDAYSTSFETFKSHMFFTAAPEQPKENARSAAPPADPQTTDAEPESESVATDPRVKELYRRLVRRLHPDLRADGSAAASMLWHEVQEAYAASDVARMELLLALSDLSDGLGSGNTLSQMQAVLAELNRSIRALEKSLQEAEGEDAWNFARTGPSEDLRVRVERQLKHQLAGREQRLDLLRRTIADWARGPVLNPMMRSARPHRRFA